jgi:predicted DNA-binding ribbon-helix-helix protein
VKRSIYLARKKTSVSIEDGFWKALKEIASRRRMTLSQLIGEIDAHRQRPNLSSAIRLFVLDYFQTQISASPD